MARNDVITDGERHRLRQKQARALGDPTRYEIFRVVADAPEPVSVAALTQHLRLNHNAVRQHLAKLCDAGLLVEQLARRRGPGRPALQYILAAGAAATWVTTNAYEQLSLLLLEVVESGGPPREVGARAGRRAVPVAGQDQALAALEAEVTRRGFEPERVERASGVDIILRRCPFAVAASANPEVVCELHRGLAEGMVEGLGGQLEVRGLFRKDPRRAGCRLQLHWAGHPPEPSGSPSS